MFYAKQYEEAIDLIGKVRQMFPGPNLEIKFIHALIARYFKNVWLYQQKLNFYLYHRYNEIVNKQPLVVSHDLLKKVKPKTDDDKVMYIYVI